MQTTFPAIFLTRRLHGFRCGSEPVRQRHDLDRRKLLTVSFPAGGRVSCIRGRVWITRDGDTADIVLSDGESLVCHRRTRAHIEALDCSAIEVVRSHA